MGCNDTLSLNRVRVRILPMEIRLIQTGMYVNTLSLTSLETFYIDRQCETALKLFGNYLVRTCFGVSNKGLPGPLLLITGQVIFMFT